MKLTKVTMTGADDSVQPERLFEISEIYPFVEWGLLVSRNSQGHNRFPSLKWLNRLNELDAKYFGAELQYSCHLCGGYVREILMGDVRFIELLGDVWEMFQRVQINTHGIPHQYDMAKMAEALKEYKDKEYIFQYDNANASILNSSITQALNCSTLFDLSHGAGVLPDEWPVPISGIKCGYAGGLSPENVLEQIKLIESKVGDIEIWIDMETRVRSNNDKLLDLKKVEKVLAICAEFFQTA